MSLDAGAMTHLSLAQSTAAGPMPQEEYGCLLNTLLEAERAGAKRC